MQVRPSPVYPGLQIQSKDRLVLLQYIWYASQLCSPVSNSFITSAKKKQYRHISCTIWRLTFVSSQFIINLEHTVIKKQQHVMNWRVPTFFAAFSFKTRRTHTSISLLGKSRLTDSAIIAFDFITGTLNKKVFLVDLVVIIEKIRAQIKLVTRKWLSVRKHPFLLALRRWGRFAPRNCDSATEIPYWWRKSMFS